MHIFCGQNNRTCNVTVPENCTYVPMSASSGPKM